MKGWTGPEPRVYAWAGHRGVETRKRGGGGQWVEIIVALVMGKGDCQLVVHVSLRIVFDLKLCAPGYCRIVQRNSHRVEYLGFYVGTLRTSS